MEIDKIDLKYKNHAKHITGACRMPGRKGVFCDSYSECDKCGWNYYVEAKRKDRIREKTENCS